MLTQELHERLQNGLGMGVLVDVGTQQDRGAGVHTVENLDHMLTFAVATGIRRHRGGIECASIWISWSGPGRSRNRFLQGGAWRIRLLRRKTFQMVRVERGKRTFWSASWA
jgi:hypothetical protein